MVMGGDSWSEGCGVESQHYKLDGYFSHLLVKNCNVLFEKSKIKEKEARDGPF